MKRPSNHLSLGRSLATLLAVVAVAVCACGCSQEDPGVEVSREQFGERWPLTVERGTVACRGGLPVFRYDGETYALNRAGEKKGFKSLDPIWRDDPAYPALKVSLGQLMDVAMKQCH
jgi:hypothetical protein